MKAVPTRAFLKNPKKNNKANKKFEEYDEEEDDDESDLERTRTENKKLEEMVKFLKELED